MAGNWVDVSATWNGFDGHVKLLWQLAIRSISITPTGEFTWYVATDLGGTMKDAVHQARQRFEPKWWDDYIITDVKQVGKLCVIEGVPLYEPA